MTRQTHIVSSWKPNPHLSTQWVDLDGRLYTHSHPSTEHLFQRTCSCLVTSHR